MIIYMQKTQQTQKKKGNKVYNQVEMESEINSQKENMTESVNVEGENEKII